MILLLSGLKWNNAYLLMILGLAFFIYDNFSTKEAIQSEEKSTEPMNFTYGITMIILAALTEAFIYFLVRRVKTDNHWNHVFISYFLGAVFMTLYISKENQFSIAKIFKSLNNTRVGIATALNGLIGSVGHFLRFFASYRLDAGIYSVLSYFGIIMSYVYGMAFNAEKLTWPKVAGTISIIGANYFS
jgi:drug/metabolite transporter (DMT)-like permease